MTDRRATALVPIRAEGSKAPVVCVHAQAGHLRLYHALTQHLDPERPVYGLRSVLDDEAPGSAYQRFGAMAERYVREIRDLQPDGPYLLLGECDGAELAYEMAQHLRRLGEEVALLALVDSFAHGGPSRRRFVPRSAYRGVDAMRMLAFHLRTAARLDRDARREYVSVRLARLLDRSVRGVRQRPAGPTPEVAMRQGFRTALSAYDPAPYDGRVVLFRGAQLPWGVRPTSDLGWGALVSDLKVVALPAYFGTCMLEPTVGLLAESLAQAMDAALVATPI